jgi:hypothetical protein
MGHEAWNAAFQAQRSILVLERVSPAIHTEHAARLVREHPVEGEVAARRRACVQVSSVLGYV